DPDYEERGHDYPVAYVRWTEGRNIEAFLDLVAAGRVAVKPLITHRFSIDEAPRAYQLISGGLKENYLAVVLNYDTEREVLRRIENQAAGPGAAAKSTSATRSKAAAGRVGVGLI